MAKGDTISVWLRGVPEPIRVTASKNGRKLTQEAEKEGGVMWVLIHEKTWTDVVVKTTKFSASDVIAVVSDVRDGS